MFQAWKKHPVILTAGYIIGFPNDTRASVLQDIEVIKRELPVDILSLTILTPLPGSEDHRNAVAAGTWIDPDLNKYDLAHCVFNHPNFTGDALDNLYREAISRFYSPDHCLTILRRAAALGSDKKFSTMNRLLVYGTGAPLHNVYSLDGGYLRKKYRRDRRPGSPLENPLTFYAKYYSSTVKNTAIIITKRLKFTRFIKDLWSDPARFDYTDQAIAETHQKDFETLDLYIATRGGKEAVASHQKMESIKKRARRKTIVGV